MAHGFRRIRLQDPNSGPTPQQPWSTTVEGEEDLQTYNLTDSIQRDNYSPLYPGFDDFNDTTGNYPQEFTAPNIVGITKFRDEYDSQPQDLGPDHPTVIEPVDTGSTQPSAPPLEDGMDGAVGGIPQEHVHETYDATMVGSTGQVGQDPSFNTYPFITDNIFYRDPEQNAKDQFLKISHKLEVYLRKYSNIAVLFQDDRFYGYLFELFATGLYPKPDTGISELLFGLNRENIPGLHEYLCEIQSVDGDAGVDQSNDLLPDLGDEDEWMTTSDEQSVADTTDRPNTTPAPQLVPINTNQNVDSTNDTTLYYDATVNNSPTHDSAVSFHPNRYDPDLSVNLDTAAAQSARLLAELAIHGETATPPRPDAASTPENTNNPPPDNDTNFAEFKERLETEFLNKFHQEMTQYKEKLDRELREHKAQIEQAVVDTNMATSKAEEKLQREEQVLADLKYRIDNMDKVVSQVSKLDSKQDKMFSKVAGYARDLEAVRSKYNDASKLFQEKKKNMSPISHIKASLHEAGKKVEDKFNNDIRQYDFTVQGPPAPKDLGMPPRVRVPRGVLLTHRIHQHKIRLIM